ncbi:TPA: hypothetical protein ACKQCJ_000383 [Stenotrophomonas maltophilia]
MRVFGAVLFSILWAAVSLACTFLPLVVAVALVVWVLRLMGVIQ